MRIVTGYSRALPEDLRIVQAAMGIARTADELQSILKIRWPEVDIYLGGTHWRVFPVRGNQTNSIYIDKEGA